MSTVCVTGFEATPAARGSGLFSTNSWSRLSTSLQLSQRELQIVQHIFEDRKEDAIAFELGISPHTVNTYVQRLYTKLAVRSRAQLIVCVVARYLEDGANAVCQFGT
jgi:DNA-binding NarL/FixJ family response regulator